MPLDVALRALPSRVGPTMRAFLRAALDHSPIDRANAEELFYVLEPARAKRRHAVIELRGGVAALLDLGTGGFARVAVW